MAAILLTAVISGCIGYLIGSFRPSRDLFDDDFGD
jgi:hypothetical protein